MLVLFLLQIFNGVDWDCAAGFHSWDSDSNTRAEHRMETTNLPDVENLLLAAWQTTCVGLDPFIHIPQLEKYGEGADGFGSFIPLPDRSSGPPPEEPVPRRC